MSNEATLGGKEIIPSIGNVLNHEEFFEKKMKSKGLVAKFVQYCTETEYFPLIMATLEDEIDFGQIAFFFKVVCGKFNTIQKVYGIINFPFDDGENTNLKSLKQAAQYWLDTSVHKAKFLYNILDSPQLSQPILHDKLIQLMLNAFNKMQIFSKQTFGSLITNNYY